MTLIGRAPDCDVLVFDAQVSRHHAQVLHQGTEYHVQSLQQSNPVIVNDRVVTGRRRLVDGDLIVVGGVVFEVDIPPITRTDTRDLTPDRGAADRGAAHAASAGDAAAAAARDPADDGGAAGRGRSADPDAGRGAAEHQPGDAPPTRRPSMRSSPSTSGSAATRSWRGWLACSASG